MKMKNPTHSVQEANPVLLLIKESLIKSKTVRSWSCKTKREY